MNHICYLKNQLPIIALHLTGALALSLFLAASGNNLQSIVFICMIWMISVACYLTAAFFLRNNRLKQLLSMTELLEERYLIAELMPVPKKAEEQVFYQVFKLAEASMLEKINEVTQDQKAYREYIEQWIHEIKTPITAMKLLCENNRSDFSRELLAQLEKTNRCTEQALYYARSGHAQKDYSIRETRLDSVIHAAIADNKYLLRQNHTAVTVEAEEHPVFTDDKWVRFILNQLIGNAVKYGGTQQQLSFTVRKRGNCVCLTLKDHGIGIPESDLPSIFEKGFTGQNGRLVKSSTGIGLYLCRRLCDKLGIGLEAASGEDGTAMTLSFYVNHFVNEVKQ